MLVEIHGNYLPLFWVNYFTKVLMSLWNLTVLVTKMINKHGSNFLKFHQMPIFKYKLKQLSKLEMLLCIDCINMLKEITAILLNKSIETMGSKNLLRI